MALIFNRYTSKPQEKAIFAILLEWPNNGSVILKEPVVTQKQTQVRRPKPLLAFCRYISNVFGQIKRVNYIICPPGNTDVFIFHL